MAHTPGTHVRVHPDVVWRDVDGEVVILNVVSGHYFGLDEVGSRVWILLQNAGASGITLEGLRERVLEEFEGAPDVVAADLNALVDELAQQQLVFVAS